MARFDFRNRRPRRGQTLLLVALGAVAGLALGVALADRTGGIEGLRSTVRRRRRRSSGMSPDEAASMPDGAPGAPPRQDTEAYPVDEEEFEATASGRDTASGGDVDENTDLEARVLETFRNDPLLRGRAIDIGAIGDGVIELTGWVHSPAEVGHALTLARGVPGVRHVMDQLTIRGTDFRRVGSPAVDR